MHDIASSITCLARNARKKTLVSSRTGLHATCRVHVEEDGATALWGHAVQPLSQRSGPGRTSCMPFAAGGRHICCRTLQGWGTCRKCPARRGAQSHGQGPPAVRSRVPQGPAPENAVRVAQGFDSSTRKTAPVHPSARRPAALFRAVSATPRATFKDRTGTTISAQIAVVERRDTVSRSL